MKNKRFNIRKARKTDFGSIIGLLTQLAHFEKLTPPEKEAQNRLIKDAFGTDRAFNILVAENVGRDLCGYAFYFFTYSSFLARKSLYLEDIYISEKHRNKGIGKMFMKELVKIAERNDCRRMEWAVLDWNTNAIKFYDKLGAKPLKDWIYYRLKI